MNCCCTKLNCKLAWVGEKFSCVFLLVIRLVWGGSFVLAGFGKLSNAANVVPFFESLGLPGYLVYVVGVIEVVGGALLALGLFSRIAALFLTAVLIGAYSTAHQAVLLNIFGDLTAFTKEAPFPYLFTTLVVFAFGPGCLSLDSWKMKKASGEACCSTEGSNSSCCG